MKPVVRLCVANPMMSAAPIRRAASCADSGARSRPRLRSIADLDHAQMLEPIAQIREPLQRLAAQRLRVESREQPGHTDDMLDHHVLGIERGDHQCIEAGCVAQRLEIQAHQRVGVLVGKILEVDSGFGEENVQARLRTAMTRVRRKQRIGAAQRKGLPPACSVGSADSTRACAPLARRQRRQVFGPNVTWVFFFIPILPSAIRIRLVVVRMTARPIVSQRKCRRKRRALANKGFSLNAR